MPADTCCALQPSDADIEKARAEAAKNLTNIDGPERRRRILFGAGLTVSTLSLQAQQTEHCSVSTQSSRDKAGKLQQHMTMGCHGPMFHIQSIPSWVLGAGQLRRMCVASNCGLSPCQPVCLYLS